MPSSQNNTSLPFDLQTWLEFLGQFEDVRVHLMRAGAEVVLALKSLLDSLLESLEREMPGGRQKWEFLYALQYALGFIGSRIPSDAQRQTQLADELRAQKEAALNSILAVIQAEIDGLQGGDAADLSSAETNRLAAMIAIQNVLRREIEKAKATGKTKGRKEASGGRKKRPAKARPHA